MSPKEAMKLINDLQNREREALEGLIAPARAAINVLKDHNMHSTARELEAQVFAIEAAKQEIHSAIEANPRAFMEAITESLRGRGER